MTENVIINIKSTQEINGEKDSLEFTTDACMKVRNGSYYLTYDESRMYETDHVKTSLMVKSDNTVVLTRSGDMRNRLVVQKGVRSTCYYDTPGGNLVIGIFGETIKNDLTPVGGNLFMSYTIDSNLSLISRNTVNISVKEVNNNVSTCS